MVRLNSDLTESEIKTKTLPQIKKFRESATSQIRTPVQDERIVPKHQHEIHPTGHLSQPHHNQKIPKPKPESLDEDLGYFICSLICELHSRNIVSPPNPASQRVCLQPKHRAIFHEIQESQQAQAEPREPAASG